eukprot:scaffold6061_cov51-Attheya_sp.AAC.1
MAEFDSGGFSAVAAFFGEEGKKSEAEPKDLAQSKQDTKARKSRLGLGASAAPKPSNEAGGDWSNNENARKILNVGKRKRNNDNLEDEDLESDEQKVVSDDDEEEGRTSAGKEKTPVNQSENAVSIGQKKKKKGKKERMAAAAAAAQTVMNEDNNQSKSEEISGDGDQESGAAKKNKRKKPKIRSRQKNIRKDNRRGMDKPDHLILGRPSYAGRPMTPETRAKLNLPPSRTSRKQDERTKDNNSDMRDSSDGTSGLGLAVDEFLDMSGEPDEDIGDQIVRDDPNNDKESVNVLEDDKAVHEPTKTKKKKKSKKKYKNL